MFNKKMTIKLLDLMEKNWRAFDEAGPFYNLSLPGNKGDASIHSGLHFNWLAGRGEISEPITAGTSKLDWRCFEYYQIDRNEFHICPNFRKI